MNTKGLICSIFSIDSALRFNELALAIFKHQSQHNSIYKKYLSLIGTKNVQSIEDIPFMPIQFFKTHEVIEDNFQTKKKFMSSATTGIQRSVHHIADLNIYNQSFTKSFNIFYGNPKDYVFLALLPSYLQQGDSSLIYMVDGLMKLSGDVNNKFYNQDIEQLAKDLQSLQKSNKKIFLIGVTYALLDLAEKHPMKFNNNTLVLETGGMKGRRKEMVREELHKTLTNAFGIDKIHSEYGMTELLSQAYSKGDGKFQTPPWMKILIRDVNDPLSYIDEEKTGGINVIDLANIYSCSFIATQDLGKIKEDGSFEVLGRFDNSDVRGCNLLVG